MEIKIVNRPLQNENTKPEDIQYPNENWWVKTKRYMNMGQFNSDMEKYKSKGAKTMYLYEIKHIEEDIVYEVVNEIPQSRKEMTVWVRVDFKK